MRMSDWSSDVCSSDLCFLFWGWKDCSDGFEIGFGEAEIEPPRHRIIGDADHEPGERPAQPGEQARARLVRLLRHDLAFAFQAGDEVAHTRGEFGVGDPQHDLDVHEQAARIDIGRSEEHTSELQSLMCISYAVFCLKKKNLQ